MFLLDTNICMYAMKDRYPALQNNLLSIHPSEIGVSSITISELEYSASRNRWSEQARTYMRMLFASFSVIPFSDTDALLFGKLRAYLARRGNPIGLYDAMIAAQAMAREMTLITRDTDEFRCIPHLMTEDWTRN